MVVIVFSKGGCVISPPKPSTLQVALQYLAIGWSVIPDHSLKDGLCTCPKSGCPNPGKHPRLTTWTRWQRERPTESQLRAWWTQWPTANIGIVTGAVSGLVVVDIDPRHGGDINAKELNLPDTVTALTGGGGSHYYYKHPGGHVSNRSGIVPGVDLRGDGGHVVAPPSNHESGKGYLWEVGYAPWEHALADFPADMNRHDPVAEAAATARTFDQEYDQWQTLGLTEGARNTVLTRIAGHYFGMGLTYTETLERALGANGLICRPLLGTNEVQGIVKSIFQRETQKQARRAVLSALEQQKASLLTDEERLQMAQVAWAELGVDDIADWYKNISVLGVEYVLELPDRTCNLGDDILSPAKVRLAVANTTGIQLPRFKLDIWETHSRKLLMLAREERSGPLQTIERVADWTDEYLQAAREVEPELRRDALRSGTILVDGEATLRLPHFQRFIEARFGEKLTARQLGNVLRQGGWEIHRLLAERLRVWRQKIA